MKLCNYCYKPIPQGFDLWWNQRVYHPDCAVQVAVTDTNRITDTNRNLNTTTEPNTGRRERVKMNCKYCNEHIVATCQVMWRGYPFHEDCLAKAIQEVNQPQEEKFEEKFLEDIDAEGSDLDYDYEPDFEGEYDEESDEDFEPEETSELNSEFYRAGKGQAVSTEIATSAVQGIPAGQSPAAAAVRATAKEPVQSNGNNAGTLIVHCGARRITRDELAGLPLPAETKTFKPISHFDLVERITETLWYRRMNIVRDEYAVSTDGMKLFGLLEMDLEYKGVRFAIGLRNSNDKSMRVAMVAGYRVVVCDNMMLQGDFQPLLAKHSKSFALEDGLSIACDRIQRNIGKLHGIITKKQEQRIDTGFAQRLVYRAFTEGKFPISLLKTVHREFFVAPSYEEFKGSTMWSLENAFTTAFKKLQPVSQFEMTARLGKFLAPYN